MQKHTLSNASFTEIHAGAGAGILQVQKGTIAIWIGSGTPNDDACITFGTGEKWIVTTGNQLRAKAVGSPVASVVVGNLNG